ncbi:MAG: hypothetical protein KC591_13050 [Gemmatimonadetes bacterium]|nr:hypothetical protein [Gemmatimonadota bacterium]
MNSRTISKHFAAAAVLAAALTGCDPKLTGTDDNTGNPGDNPTPTVSAEALVVGQMIALHQELMQQALSVANVYEGSGAPAPRAFFGSDCVTLAEIDSGTPSWSLAMSSCTNQQGTTHDGGGQFEPTSGQDAYTFYPWVDPSTMIRAQNASDDNYNHTIEPITPGFLEFHFQRNGTNEVTGMLIDGYLRHVVRGDVVNLSYPETLSFDGAVGSFGTRPVVNSTGRVTWDGIGIFDFTFTSAGTAQYTMQGNQYQVDLTTGDVSIVVN